MIDTGVHGNNVARSRDGSGDVSTFNRPMTLAEIICHYCRLTGHTVGNCEHRQKHIQEGLLKVHSGKDCLADGTPLFVPRDGRSKRDFVDDYYKTKSSQNCVGAVAGVYDVNADKHEALFPNGTEYDPRDDEILTTWLSISDTSPRHALLSIPGRRVGRRVISG
jgi:hypothetical protein